MHRLALVFCTLTACNHSSSTLPDGAPTAPSIAGHWLSDCTVASPQQVFQLDFQIDPTTWRLDYRAFGDAACTQPFLTVHVDGPYALQEPSPVVAEAWDARFAFATKTILPATADAAAFLASAAGCNRPGFTAGVATDVLQPGCAGLGLQPLASCPAELDLAAVDHDTLRLGQRPADNNLCSTDRRPRALSAIALHRR